MKKMKLLRKLLLGLIGLVLVGIFSWAAGLFNLYAPSPEQAHLLLKNTLRGERQPDNDRFRVVLCWLDRDPKGVNTALVQDFFQRIEGIDMVRSPWILSADGASDDWGIAMQNQARPVLSHWDAHLVVAGTVKLDKKALLLWLIPRSDEGSLKRRADTPYELNSAALGDDFKDDYEEEITAAVLVAVAPLIDTKPRGDVVENGLKKITTKLTQLANDPRAIVSDDRRRKLKTSLAIALMTLGEQEGDTERLEQAVVTYETALELLRRNSAPLEWAETQANLGVSLATLGTHEDGTKNLRQAVAAFEAALDEYHREDVPFDWAWTQANLGTALMTLGEREDSTERLEQAVAAFEAALEEFSDDSRSFQWAVTQNNLGLALRVLGEREDSTERLEQAVAAYEAALKELSDDTRSTQWATTQTNLGDALVYLGRLENSTKRLEQAVTVFEAALEVFSEGDVPIRLAQTLKSLGYLTYTLAVEENSQERLLQAPDEYLAGLRMHVEAAFGGRYDVPKDRDAFLEWLNEKFPLPPRRQSIEGLD